MAENSLWLPVFHTTKTRVGDTPVQDLSPACFSLTTGWTMGTSLLSPGLIIVKEHSSASHSHWLWVGAVGICEVLGSWAVVQAKLSFAWMDMLPHGTWIWFGHSLSSLVRVLHMYCILSGTTVFLQFTVTCNPAGHSRYNSHDMHQYTASMN